MRVQQALWVVHIAMLYAAVVDDGQYAHVCCVGKFYCIYCLKKRVRAV